MKKLPIPKWILAFILVIVSIILIVLSAFMPWYHQTITMEFLGFDTTAEMRYYLLDLRVDMGMGGMGLDGSLSYSDEDYQYKGIPDIFNRVFGILLLAFFINILLIVLAIIFDKKKPVRCAIATGASLFVFILLLIAPIYVMVSLPQAFDEGYPDDEDKPGFTESFIGSETDDSFGSEYETSWGPSSGWYMIIITAVLNLLVFIIFIKMWREPEGHPLPPTPAPGYTPQQPPFYPPQQPPQYSPQQPGYPPHQY